MGKYINLIGQKIGRLLVQERVDNPNEHKAYFKCLCDCGRNKIIGSYYLRQLGERASCGCTRIINHRIYDDPRAASYNGVITGYKIGAKKRNLKWELTREDAVRLMNSDCHYCKSSPSQKRNAYSYKDAISKTISLSAKQRKLAAEIIINGIDRVDNAGHYTTENCVACCKICNAAKSDLTLEEFKNWIMKVKQYVC